MEVSVRELKNRLSEYLRRATAGEEVVITSRGRSVARLVAAPAGAEDAEAAAIARIRALPFVRPGRGGKPLGAARPIRWKPGDRLLSDIVLEDRE